jgi:tetratricopeptide (TPR) repeat protein
MLARADHLARLTSEDLHHLETAVEEFESAWERGQRPDLDGFLPVDGALRHALAVELALADLEYRRRSGEAAGADEYLNRFPEIRAVSGAETELRSAEDRWNTLPLVVDVGAKDNRPAIPGYEFLGELGRGGMGVVYKARQIAADRIVALKMIRTDGPAEPDLLARFRTEAEAAAQLQHPNIVQIFEVGAAGHRPFFAMEYVEGGTLADRLAAGPLPPAEVADLLLSLARAVAAAHARGVLHRDLKPANVLLQTENGGRSTEDKHSDSVLRPPSSVLPKITDFGLAKRLDRDSDQTKTGAVLGTPSFMAPEQAAGPSRELTPAVDVYALGATLYACLTGRPPFQAATVLETIEQVKSKEPVSPRLLQPTVPRDLETICLKCLAKEPARRYAAAADFADDLERFRAGRPILARPAGVWERGWKWVKRRPATAAALAVSVLALLTVTGVSVGFSISLKNERDATALQRDQTAKQRDRAETSYRLARQAMESGIIKVRKDQRLQRGDLEDMRKTMLKAEADFYERFVQIEGEEPAFRLERADAYYGLAGATAALGSKDEAIRHYRTAVELQRQLVAAEPDSPAVLRRLAMRLYELGRNLNETAQYGAARAALFEAESILDALHRDYPADDAILENLLDAVHFRSIADRDSRDLSSAEAGFQKLESLLVPLVRDRAKVAKYRSMLGTLHVDRSTVHEESEWNARNENDRLKAVEIYEGLVRDYPQNSNLRNSLGYTLVRLGDIYLATNRPNSAESALVRAEQLYAALCQEHPALTMCRHDLARCRGGIGSVCWNQGKTKDAIEWYRRAIDDLELLVRENPNANAHVAALGANCKNLGFILYESGQMDSALTLLDRAVEMFDVMHRRNSQYDLMRKYLVLTLWERGLVRLKLGRHDRSDFDRAVALSGADPGFGCCWQRAEARARLGDHEAAFADLERCAAEETDAGDICHLGRIAAICSTTIEVDERFADFERECWAEWYAARSVRWLAAAKAAGYFKDPAHVEQVKSDPNLDPLRSRHDFKLLFP